METKKRGDARWNFGGKGWVIIILGLLAYTVYMGFDNGLNFIAPAYAAKFGVSQTFLMLFSTIGGWVSVACIALFGVIQKKVGVKKTLMISLILGLVGAIIWAFAQNSAMYGIGCILVKAMGTIYAMVSFGELGSNWFPTKKGSYMGIITVGVVFGGLVGNGIMGTVITKTGITQGMMILVVLNIILVVLCGILVKAHPEEAGAYPDNDKSMTPEQAQALLAKVKEYQTTSEWTVAKCLRNKTVWLTAISIGFMLCIAQGMMAQLVPAALSFGHNAIIAQLASLVPMPFALIGTIVAGILDQKLGTKKITMIIFIIEIIALLVGAFIGGTVPGIFIAAACLAMAVSGGNNMIMSYTATVFGRFDFSTPYMVILFIVQLISSFGYILVSGLGEASSTYKLCFYCCAILAVIGLILWIFNPDKFLGRTDAGDSQEA